MICMRRCADRRILHTAVSARALPAWRSPRTVICGDHGAVVSHGPTVLLPYRSVSPPLAAGRDPAPGGIPPCPRLPRLMSESGATHDASDRASEALTARPADRPAEAWAESGVSRALFEQSPFSTVIYDAEGHLLAVNPAFRALWGVGIETAPAGYSILTDPELERQGALPLIRRAFAGEPVVTPVVRYDISRVAATGAGRSVWTQAHLFPVRNTLGVITHVVLTHIDLTARMEAEEALRVSEERFRGAQEGSLDAFVILRPIRDDAGGIVDFGWDYANP